MAGRILNRPLAVILIIFVLLGGGGLVAYKVIYSNYGLRSHEIISYNNLYALSVPSDWEKSSGASKNAVIAAESPSGSMYAMMSSDSDFDAGLTMEEYVNAYINKMAQSSDNPLVQVVARQPEEATMGDYTGYYFELDSSAGGVAVHTWDFVFTGPDGYIHVDVVSEGENHNDQNDTARNILSSARIL